MNDYQIIFKDSKHFIDKRIYNFLFILIHHLFHFNGIGIRNKLDEVIEHINKNIIKEEKLYINKDDYSEKNFFNILLFVKSQNKIYAAEILENILIKNFSLAMKFNKNFTFEKNLYNNMKNFQDNNINFSEFFDKLNQNDFKQYNINQLMSEDILKDKEETLSNFQNKIVIYKILKILYKEKNNISKFEASRKFMGYKYRDKFVFDKNNILENNNNSKTRIDKFESTTYYTGIFSANFHEDEEKKNVSELKIFKSFFISAYIYYQNRHSPFLQFIEPQGGDMDKIPFAYDLTGAGIDFSKSDIIFAPSRILRIEELLMGINKLKSRGVFEISKALLFNKNIKVVDISNTVIKSELIEPFNLVFGLFDNYNIEVLNLSHNYLRNNSEHYLARLLSHLKGLKTINFYSNNLKDGIASFLTLLKQLYREEKISLENLNLNNCQLDDISFYELGELLKSRYCKLKRVYLYKSNIPSNIKFLKKLKKNRSLVEIIFNDGNFGNEDADDIMRVMSNSNIQNFNLYKNKFSDFDICLRILNRTKIVHSNNTKEKQKEESNLYNLDLSKNEFLSINTEQIKLLKEIIDNTTLYCLDITSTLFGKNPNKILYERKPTEYQKVVFELKDQIDDTIKKYFRALGKINDNKIDIKKLEKYKNEDSLKNFEISDTIENDNSKYTLYLNQKAEEMINEYEEYDKLNFDKKEEIRKKLVNYMKLKIAERNLKQNEDIIKETKFIFI